jgi:acyl carrier protein
METSNHNIEKILYDYIYENFLPHNKNSDLTYDENLFQSGTVDSAGLISFLCFIERKFSINIPDEDLLPQKFSTIESIADYIRTKLLTLSNIKNL